MSESTEVNVDELNEQQELLAALREKVVVKVLGKSVIMDPARLELREATLSRFFDEEGSWYNYFGRHLAGAEYVVAIYEADYESLYYGKISSFKEEGGSDKAAESKAKSDPAVVEMKKKLIVAKYHMKLIAQHLRSWDKTHENAQNRGHTLRKEMDKLDNDIYAPAGSTGTGGGHSNRRGADITTDGDLDKLLQGVQ